MPFAPWLNVLLVLIFLKEEKITADGVGLNPDSGYQPCRRLIRDKLKLN
jgi:hypothetical protein